MYFNWNLHITIGKILFPVVFLCDRLEFLSLFLSISFSRSPSTCRFPSLYRHNFYLYPPSCPVSSRILRDIFHILYWVFPIPYPGTWLLGVFLLFRLSHMYSMQQRLDGGLLINAKAEISAIIICLEGFSGLNVPIVGTPWIIHVHYLK